MLNDFSQSSVYSVHTIKTDTRIKHGKLVNAQFRSDWGRMRVTLFLLFQVAAVEYSHNSLVVYTDTRQFLFVSVLLARQICSEKSYIPMSIAD